MHVSDARSFRVFAFDARALTGDGSCANIWSWAEQYGIRVIHGTLQSPLSLARSCDARCGFLTLRAHQRSGSGCKRLNAAPIPMDVHPN